MDFTKWKIGFCNSSRDRRPVRCGDSLSTWWHRLQNSETLSPHGSKSPVFGIPKISSVFLLPGLLESSGCEEARQASWLETRQIIDGKAESLLPKPNQFLPNVLIWSFQTPSNRQWGFFKSSLLSCSCPKKRSEANNVSYLCWKSHNSE